MRNKSSLIYPILGVFMKVFYLLLSKLTAKKSRKKTI